MPLTVRENFSPIGASFHPNNLSQRYQDLRYSLLAAFEGVETSPYFDSVGLLSIGTGFNLTDAGVRNLVLDELGVPLSERQAYANIIAAGGSLATITAALNQRLGHVFVLDATQTRRVFDRIAVQKEDRLIIPYATSIGFMPESHERAVLFSLAYNEKGIGKLIGDNLQRALKLDDRAQAWFEIRYNSNGGNSSSVGIARRRYYESELFGLYSNPAAVTAAEADQTYRMLQLHRNQIINYEGRWGRTPSGVRGWDRTAQDQTGIEAANAANGYPLSFLPNGQVETLEASLARAKPRIVAKVLQDYGQYVSQAQLLAIRASDVYLDPGRSSSKQAVNPNYAGFLDSIGDPFSQDPEANDLMLGEGGSDRLYGRGRDDIGLGQDYLTAGTGADALEGNEGVDLLQGGAGNDSLLGDADNDLLDPGANSDTADGGDGADLVLAGTGPDTLNPGAGADVIAYNAGDGQDAVNPGTGVDKTVSLGGGILYADLAFRKNANDLVLETGGTESLTFKNWYAAPANQQFVTLQVIAEAMAGYNPGSADPLLNQKVQSFDFAELTGAFDAARTADPLLTRWELMNALLDSHLAASDDAALGGDLAYQYGLNGTLAGIGTGAAQDVLGSAQFGVQAQQLRPLATLQEGPVRLGA